jgi:hypothetical protein
MSAKLQIYTTGRFIISGRYPLFLCLNRYHQNVACICCIIIIIIIISITTIG